MRHQDQPSATRHAQRSIDRNCARRNGKRRIGSRRRLVVEIQHRHLLRRRPARTSGRKRAASRVWLRHRQPRHRLIAEGHQCLLRIDSAARSTTSRLKFMTRAMMILLSSMVLQIPLICRGRARLSQNKGRSSNIRSSSLRNSSFTGRSGKRAWTMFEFAQFGRDRALARRRRTHHPRRRPGHIDPCFGGQVQPGGKAQRERIAPNGKPWRGNAFFRGPISIPCRRAGKARHALQPNFQPCSLSLPVYSLLIAAPPYIQVCIYYSAISRVNYQLRTASHSGTASTRIGTMKRLPSGCSISSTSPAP